LGEKVEEEKLRKTAEMLLAGGKMLGVHCGKCLSPLFEFQGKVVCPVCGGETRPTKPEAKAPSLKKVEDVLHAKINSLAEQLAEETDHAKILELLERIKSALEALEKLKEG
jgi:UPF0148 protein